MSQFKEGDKVMLIDCDSLLGSQRSFLGQVLTIRDCYNQVGESFYSVKEFYQGNAEYELRFASPLEQLL